jgi:hypothetical protein
MDVRVFSGKLPGATRHPFGLRRMTGLAILTVLVAAMVAYMQVTVPITDRNLARANSVHYWQVAMNAGLVVLAGQK